MKVIDWICSKVLTCNLDEESLRYRAVLTRSLTWILIAVMVFFTAYEYAAGHVMHSLLILSAALTLAVAVVFFSDRIGLVSNLVVVCTLALFMFSVTAVEEMNWVPFWIPAFPLITVFLLGEKRGMLWTALFVLALGGAMAYFYLRYGRLPLEPSVMLNSLLVFLLVFHSAMTYEKINNFLLAKLRSRAEYDSLTNALNRYKFFEILESEFARARRYATPFSLLMLDVDDFKKVNDTYGHIVGDRMLQTLASLIENNIRKTDVLARYGGEEFIVLARDTGMLGAVRMAEKLRLLIEAHDFGSAGNGSLRASFGVATWEEGDTVESLVKRVDEALYTAKRMGKNKVVSKSGKKREAV